MASADDDSGIVAVAVGDATATSVVAVVVVDADADADDADDVVVGARAKSGRRAARLRRLCQNSVLVLT